MCLPTYRRMECVVEKALISGFLEQHAEAASAKHSKREREQIEEQQLGA